MKQEELKALFDQLTLEEKIGQLIQLNGKIFHAEEKVATGPIAQLGIDDEQAYTIGSILNTMGAKSLKEIQDRYLKKNKKHIPLLFMADIINGFKTIFPISLGLGCSFDPELVKKTAQVAAKEAAVSGVHVTFSPMIDLVRDARWGRVMESYGEDTYLNCLYAKAMVEGYQGDNDPSSTIASCVKHFAAYGAVVAGKEYNTVELSERTLHQDYLPAYKAAIDAGCKMIMTSFNTVDGIPVTANRYLLHDILRVDWGFEGVVISDHSAVKELIPHGIAKDLKEATRLSINAGCDIDMMTSAYATHLKELVEEGSIDETVIDEAAMRVLNLKNKLGLFEHPYRGANEAEEKRYVLCEEFRRFAKEVVSQTVVLLKNEQVLPLRNDQKVAIVGPYANTKDLSGMWSINVDREKVISIYDGFQKKADHVMYVDGYPFVNDAALFESFSKYSKTSFVASDDVEGNIKEAIACAKDADVIVVAIGEHPQQSGEGGSRGEITIPEVQIQLLKEMKQLGKPIVTLVFSGRPLALSTVADLSDALLQCWFPGTEGGDGIADVVYGEVNPSARLAMTFPYAVGQCPIYYNHHRTGRPAVGSTHSKRFTSRYIDIPVEPAYCFGYGLSYSSFVYGKVVLSSPRLEANGAIQASVSVINDSDIAGVETVQLYLRDLYASVVRPVKELKGVKKVLLQPHETKTVTFEIEESMLRFYSRNNLFESEAGEFEIFIGHDSSTENKTTMCFEK